MDNKVGKEKYRDKKVRVKYLREKKNYFFEKKK